MGYTHYFEQSTDCPQDKFDLIVADFGKIAHDQVAVLRGPDGTGMPFISATEIDFNGDAATEQDHEPMTIQTISDGFAFCNTALKAYDTAVVALLIIMAHHAPNIWRISSDGDASDWAAGRNLVKRVLGYDGL